MPFRLSSTRLRVACASLAEGALRKACPFVALTGACSASLNRTPLVHSTSSSAGFLQVACAFPSGKGPCKKLCPSVNCHSLPALPQWKLPCEKHVRWVIAILLALTCERAAYAFQVEAPCEKYVPRKFCMLPLLLAVAVTGACSASLNVLTRSSGFLVLRGVIHFGRLRTPLVHFSSFVLWGKILPSASRGFLCCLPKEKEFGPYRVPIFASPPRGAGGTPKYLPCSMLSSHIAVSVAWPAGSYAHALGFGALCRRTTAKAFAKDVFINQERKLGARRRSDTVLVSTINDADQGSADVTFRTPLAPYEKSKFLGSRGSMVARLKLKGIDGRAPPGVEPAA
ncbi:hypothetical protein TEA_008117 [Camellia sinensis var. sinensis]|uniref:Uncharacterized protein n=1 Tax=Camellia sinensis var. sinensis TaxID=542762 RepID=A0A4S4E652_CAMSN|nr:hypothetical protein TEA_008117 [Camellia sinensis var. sinensis]